MKVLRITLICFLLTHSFFIKAQPWQRIMNGPATGPVLYSLTYEYHPQFGGVALHNKNGGNYHQTFISYNKKGDTTFRKEISFDSLWTPIPYIYDLNGKIDNYGNRYVYGSLDIFTNNDFKWFVLKYDSSGTLQSNRYVGDAYLPNGTFELLLSGNNFEYNFFCIDSIGSAFFNNNFSLLYPHSFQQYIVKRDLAGNLIWQFRWTQTDTTIGSVLYDIGYLKYANETSDKQFTFLRWNPSMLSGPSLEKINSSGISQYSVSLSTYINPVNGFVMGSFVTKDTCTNYYGVRTSPTNSNQTQENFIIKINKNGQLIDSLFSTTLYFQGGSEISSGDILVSYFNYATPNQALAEGILVLDKNFNTKSVFPAQSLEIYSSLIRKNNSGGCHLGNYINDPTYTNDYTFEMCNYDSLFNTYSNKITGSVYEDNNTNCVFDTGDNTLSKRAIVCSDAQNNNYYGYSISSGAYSLRVPNGTYTLNHNPGAYRSVECPNPAAIINCNGTNTLVTQNYFDSIVPNMNDLKISLISDPFWIGIGSSLTAYYENVGTLTSTATIKIIKDPLFSYSVSIPQAASISGDTAFYTIPSIPSGGSGYININLTPSQNLAFGNQITFKGSIDNGIFDADSLNNKDSLTNLFYGSLKTASPTVPVSTSNNINVNKPRYIDGSEELFYKIRFQNTTGALVKDVLIIDSLSKHLDYSTLKILAATHNYSFSLNPKGKLMVKFTNTNLQDSAANESQSKGYLIYSIKPKTSWPLGKLIKNSASIYFDYLHALQTNEVVNEKQAVLVGIKKETGKLHTALKVYPNPAKDEIYVYPGNNNSVHSVEIYNLLGQQLVTYPVDYSGDRILIPVGALENGAYLLKVNSSEGAVTKKILIRK